MEQKESKAQDSHQAGSRLRYHSHVEVSKHNVPQDCWVSFFGRVYDLSPLIKNHPGLLAQPIIRAAGEDITHWFDPTTREPKTCLDAETGLQTTYTPNGRYLHIPPPFPDAKYSTDIGTPWWRDSQYLIGLLSKRKRKIKIINTLTSQEDTLEVCCEETLEEIQARYSESNNHAHKYTWKRLGRPLNMKKTLEQNDVVDESEEFEELGIPVDEYTPAIHIHFNDDLTDDA